MEGESLRLYFNFAMALEDEETQLPDYLRLWLFE